MSERDALAAVRRARASLERKPITVRAGKTDLSVDPTTIGLDVDAAATVRNARIAGRSHNPIDQVAGAVLRRFRDDEVPFVLKVDHVRFDALLDAWVAQTGKGLVDGGLRFEGLERRRDRAEVRHRHPARRGQGPGDGRARAPGRATRAR